MAYGKNKGRSRETRVGRFAPNMGGEGVPVKSTDVESAYCGHATTKGRFRETRVGRFAPNMGAREAPVKSPEVERVPDADSFASKKL